MTTFSYVVTGEETRVIAELSHGPDVVVERDGRPLVGYELVDGQEVEVPLDSTVVVEPGDVLRCPVLLVASYLDPSDAATADALSAAQETPLSATVSVGASVSHVVGDGDDAGETGGDSETPAPKARRPRS